MMTNESSTSQRPCIFYNQGSCNKGQQCRFSHSSISSMDSTANYNRNFNHPGHGSFQNSNDHHGRGRGRGRNNNNNRKGGGPQLSGPCKYYAAGKCRFGKNCILKHDNELIDSLTSAWENASTDAPFAVRDHPLRPKMDYKYLAVLDLEGKDEIIEFPVLVLNTETLREEGRFHRWVRPKYLFDQDNQGEENPSSKSIPFEQVLADFGVWIDSVTNGAPWCFLTCGDWDVKTQVPKQCEISGIKLPEYAHKWMNIKDVFLNHYRKHARGMTSMLNHLKIPLDGVHHLGMDDVFNIAKVAAHAISSGVDVTETGWKEGRIAHFRYANRCSNFRGTWISEEGKL